jgi:hypothetical protein
LRARFIEDNDGTESDNFSNNRFFHLAVHGFREFSFGRDKIGLRGAACRLNFAHFYQRRLDVGTDKPPDDAASFPAVFVNHRRTVTVQNRDTMLAEISKCAGGTIAQCGKAGAIFDERELIWLRC